MGSTLHSTVASSELRDMYEVIDVVLSAHAEACRGVLTQWVMCTTDNTDMF